jgi:hypothetical protein
MTRTNARQCFASFHIFFLLAALAMPAAAQKQPSDEELVKQTQNPVADLITVPLQNNFNFETGSKNRTVWVGNIQPVIPIKIGDDWNLITRTIVPIINQPSLFPGMSSATGLGDINPTFFLTSETGRIDLGRRTDIYVADRYGLFARRGEIQPGPGGSRVDDAGTWVFGALMNNQWSVAGWGSGHVNQMLIQPFVNYNLPNHWYLVSAPILTANWAAAKAGDVWTVRLAAAWVSCLGLGRYFH